ncbi:MAG: SMC-Scp complex subunit ScpB, partial [Oscillospiraceae bacterium]
MPLTILQQQIFAILFSSGEPISVKRIAQAIDCDVKTTIELLNNLQDSFLHFALPLIILKLEESYQLATLPQYAHNIKTCLDIKKNTPLTAPAMEVLSIVAYHQPVTRAFIEQVRGIDSSSFVIS